MGHKSTHNSLDIIVHFRVHRGEADIPAADTLVYAQPTSVCTQNMTITRAINVVVQGHNALAGRVNYLQHVLGCNADGREGCMKGGSLELHVPRARVAVKSACICGPQLVWTTNAFP